jgi:hypothetical protein
VIILKERFNDNFEEVNDRRKIDVDWKDDNRTFPSNLNIVELESVIESMYVQNNTKDRQKGQSMKACQFC